MSGDRARMALFDLMRATPVLSNTATMLASRRIKAVDLVGREPADAGAEAGAQRNDRYKHQDDASSVKPERRVMRDVVLAEEDAGARARFPAPLDRLAIGASWRQNRAVAVCYFAGIFEPVRVAHEPAYRGAHDGAEHPPGKP